ncbi:MAG: flagellar biosynthesis regulator FlaF [Alphaproteobacteria bacterium]|nr:flagellar biosynthesis regulator FlaF [Alphaproteobacteria bacterium]
MSSEHATAQYRQPSRQGGSPRETEGRALLEAARRLTDAQKEPVDREALLETVRLNWRLWTIFQSEASSPESPLPDAIKENVIKLCNFVDKQTVDILSKPSPEKLDILISINRNIAAGLLTKPDAQAQPDQPAEEEIQTFERLSA